MDLQKFYGLFRWLDYTFFTLNTEKYIILTDSLLILKNDNHFKKVFFWGVIQSIDSEYYIAFGIGTDAISDRVYFYSDDCQNWNLLPVPQPEHMVLTELCKRPFQGDPSLVLEIVDEMANFQTDEEKPKGDKLRLSGEATQGVDNQMDIVQSNKNVDNMDTNKIDAEISERANIEPGILESAEGRKTIEKEVDLNKDDEQHRISNVIKEEIDMQITSGELKEEDRLAAIVRIISEEAGVVPRGGLFKQTDGVTVHSRAFEGLSVEDADELCSYQHYRTPWQEWNTNLLTRVDYNYAMDFLDTIDTDTPQDIWSAQLVEGDSCIMLNNLTWPGLTFFHHMETPDHGFLYIGNGQRNLDVPFMTQVNEPALKELLVENIPENETESRRESKMSKTSKTSKRSSEQPEVTNEEEQLLPLPVVTEEQNGEIKNEELSAAF